MNKSKYINSATTTVIGTQPTGKFSSITVGETAAGAITVTDKTGDVKAYLKASIAEGTYEFNSAYTGYLSVVTDAASKIIINWE